MEQYISKSALVAEINKLKNISLEYGYTTEQRIVADVGKDLTLKGLLDFLDTLEVKEVQEEPVSEDSKKHISLVTERMLKEGPIPTLRGKEKADFENEFNRFKQITGMINWPSREEIYKNVILWFIAWSKEHLKIGDIVDKSEIDKEPVSEDLEEAVNAYIGYAPEVDESSSTYGKRQAFKAGAKWQRQKDEHLIWQTSTANYEKGKQEVIDKTCEFLKSYRRETRDGMGYVAGIIDDDTIEDFKKLMKD